MNKKILIWIFAMVLVVKISFADCVVIPKDPGCTCTRDDECAFYSYNVGFCNTEKKCDTRTIEMEGITVIGEEGWDDIPIAPIVTADISGGIYDVVPGTIKIIVPWDYYTDYTYYDKLELTDNLMFQWEYNPERKENDLNSIKYDDYFFNAILECKNLGLLINSFIKGYPFAQRNSYYKTYSAFKADDTKLLESYYPGISSKKVFVPTLNQVSNELCILIVNVIGRDSWVYKPEYKKLMDDSVTFYLTIPQELAYEDTTPPDQPTLPGGITPGEKPQPTPPVTPPSEGLTGDFTEDLKNTDFSVKNGCVDSFGDNDLLNSLNNETLVKLINKNKSGCVDSKGLHLFSKCNEKNLCEKMFEVSYCGSANEGILLGSIGSEMQFNNIMVG